MGSTTEEIAYFWRSQMKKGYLKLAILFTLIKGQSHGYQLMKRINELTLGIITPTAGAIYPALKELEKINLIKGEWEHEEKKVYHITDRGRDVFRKAVEKHFELASSIRRWTLKELTDLKIVEGVEIPTVTIPFIKLLLLNEKASAEERIESLEKLKIETESLVPILTKMVAYIDHRIEELKHNEVQSKS
ncbi:MAG: PadR family transcriptional regulator [Candidatus Methylarchaceae archaeon HK02M1]|nr:PadR family transcriptional regulator [Candidatus Methylarchaceae archaeon HK02M1]